MSGAAGGGRIPRSTVEQTVKDYSEKILSKIEGFKDAKLSGSFNRPDKEDFGDIDIIVTIETGEDKKTVKQKIATLFQSLPDSELPPLQNPKYKGKKFINHGEMVSNLYPISGMPGEYVQIDNIISLSAEEGDFKKTILDYPAELQGLILGLVKVPLLEEDPKKVFSRLGIDNIPEPKEDQEYEFHIDTSGLTLRLVTYGGNYKILDSNIVWQSRSFDDVRTLLKDFNLDGTFEDLMQQLQGLKNERSKNRVKGYFAKSIKVGAAEQGTPKGDSKQNALDAVSMLEENRRILSRAKLMTKFLDEDAKPRIAVFPGAFKPPHRDHVGRILAAANKVGEDGKVLVLISPLDRAKEGEEPISAKQAAAVFELYKEKGIIPLNVTVKVSEMNSPIGAAYKEFESDPTQPYIAVFGKDDASRYRNIEDRLPNVTPDSFEDANVGDISASDLRKAIAQRDKEVITRYLPTGITADEYLNTLGIDKPLDEGDIESAADLWTPHASMLSKMRKEPELLKGLWKGLSKPSRRALVLYFRREKQREAAAPLEEAAETVKEAQGKKLRVFDFDDTLVHVDATIYITHEDGSKEGLTPAEYAVYEPQPGDKFNFKEFSSVIKKAKPLEDNIQDLIKSYNDPTEKTTILTARLLGYPVKKYLRDEFNIEPYVVGLGSSDPQDKAKWIEDQIKKGYTTIEFRDDSAKNVDAVAALQDKHPEITLTSILIKENASYSSDIDYKGKILELTKHMLRKGMNIKPLPKVKFVNGDSDNARQFLGKTAYYDPNNKTIVLYTEGRHPKDIVRSFAHEMVHHTQNLENRLGDVSTTNTMEDSNIDKLEQEANLKGTMTFRNWTDSLNENIFQKSLDQTEKEALEIAYKNWDTFGGKECNNGFCDIFAKNLAKHLPGSKILSTEDPRNETLGHVWVEYEGKYFDAETPDGVSSWKDLPWMKEFYSKVRSYPTDIETLNEVGEANLKPYKWQEVDREGYSIYVRFETESETTYSVDLSTDKYKDTPVFLIEFSAKTKEHQGSSSRVVVNKGEMYRVMSTLTDIIKTYLKKFKKVKGIVYYPSKKGNEEFGTQRDNLYRAFIIKAIPGIKFEPVNTALYGDGIVALMPDTVVKEIVTGTFKNWTDSLNESTTTNSYPFKVTDKTYDDEDNSLITVSYELTTPDNSYRVEFYSGEHRPEAKTFDLSFGVNTGDLNTIDTFQMTGEGNARKIFKTILNIVEDFINKEDVEKIVVDGTDEKRKRIYKAIFSSTPPNISDKIELKEAKNKDPFGLLEGLLNETPSEIQIKKINISFELFDGTKISEDITLAMSPNSQGVFELGANIAKYTGLSLKDAQEYNETPDDAYAYGLVNTMNDGQDIYFWTNGIRLAGKAKKAGAQTAIIEQLAHEGVHLTRAILAKSLMGDKFPTGEWPSIGEQDNDTIEEEQLTTALSFVIDQISDPFIEMAKEYIPELNDQPISENSLNEVGEGSSKPYEWREDFDEYVFTTDSNVGYIVSLSEMPEGGKMGIAVEFLAKTPEMDGYSSKIEVGRGELFRVMATIIDIIKSHLSKDPEIEFILYSPSKKTGEGDIGNQRDKLYKIFLQKQIPGIRIRDIGTSAVIAYLPKRDELNLEINKPGDGNAAPYGSGYNKVDEKKDPFGLNQYARELAQGLEETIVMEGRYDTISNQISSEIFNNWKAQFDKNNTREEALFTKSYDLENAAGRPIVFDLAATLTFTETEEGTYSVNGDADEGDEEVYDADGELEDEGLDGSISMYFQVDPRELPRLWSKISMDLKDIVRHEIEHLTQAGYNVVDSKRLPDDRMLRMYIQDLKTMPERDYYLLDKEIPAMLQGMYFKAKKMKAPFAKVVNDYLTIQKVSDEDREIILNRWRPAAKTLNLPDL